MDVKKIKNDLLVRLNDKKYFASVSLERLVSKDDSDYEGQLDLILKKIEQIALIETGITYINAIFKDDEPAKPAQSEEKL